MVEKLATAAAEEADDGPNIAPQNLEIASKKEFRQKRNMFWSVHLWSIPLFLEVPAKKECSFFFFEPRFLWIPGNSGDSCSNAQLRMTGTYIKYPYRKLHGYRTLIT